MEVDKTEQLSPVTPRDFIPLRTSPQGVLRRMIPAANTIRKAWYRLVEPSHDVLGLERRYHSRLLASLLVALLPLGYLIAALPGLIEPGRTVLGDMDFLITTAATGFWVLAFLLTRQGRYEVAVLFMVFIATAAIFGAAVTDNFIEDTYYFVMPLLVSSIVLPLRITALLGLTHLALILVIPLFIPNMPLWEILPSPFSFVGVGFTLILVTARHRNRLEHERRARLAAYAADLEHSNRELEQFAHVASHDLQEPLRMVVSYLQLLERRYQAKLGSEADEFIAYAVQGSLRMQTLIQGLLDYSRIGTQGAPFRTTNSQVALALCLDNLQVRLEETQAVVTQGPLPFISADENQLVQLFQNLIANALKFRTQAQPRIHIYATRLKDHWQFSIEDNGIGIDPQYDERIFQIFQRLHSDEAYPGTGVGLAICKRIVERHGGQIWVESQPLEGATFHFTIPDRPGRDR